MGAWRLSADALARSRFVLSPLSETIAALTVLSPSEGSGVPWQRAFRAQHREAYLDMLASDQRIAAVAARLWRPRRADKPGWMAEFLSLPPVGPDASFEDELDRLAEWSDTDVRRELAAASDVALPSTLDGPGATDAVAEILRWVWSATLVSDWPRRRRVLQADIVARTNRLAQYGWAGVFDSLGRRRRWLGDGRIQINGYDVPDLDISHASELSFVPVHSHGSWTVASRSRYALIYPVTGAMSAVEGAHRSGLGRLMGTNRARILTLLDDPRTTTQLAALTTLPMGAISNHLKILLEAGLVLRRRSGRDVLYWRTGLGDSLAATQF